MTTQTFGAAAIDPDVLREEIRKEYRVVATDPQRGFHFHTGRKLASIVGYEDAWLDGLPESAIESFAGTGNPFSLGRIAEGERVIDLGCGAGIDSLIAAGMTGPQGNVIGIDLTPEMVDKARRGAQEADLPQARFEVGRLEEVPVEDGWADVVISNGVLNLAPDKEAAFTEIRRILRPGGRIQIGDIIVRKRVGEGAKKDPRLWTG
jgi:SAM-dependent methyltransferase